MSFKLFTCLFESIVAEYLSAIDQNADLLEILFYHKMLEALTYQCANSVFLVNAYTYSYFLNELFAKQYLFSNIRNNKAAVSILEYALACPNKELVNNWQRFVNVILKDRTPYSLSDIQSILDSFKDLDGLGVWFATEFYQWVKDQPFDNDCAGKLIEYCNEKVHIFLASYNATMKQFLGKLKKYKETLEKINTQKSNWSGSYENLKNCWGQLQTEVISPLASQEFIVSFKESSLPSTVKLICCNLMNGCIEAIDTLIKSLKSNTTVTPAQKRGQFKIMLNVFNDLCIQWLQNIMPENGVRYHASWPLDRYTRQLQRLFNEIVNNSSNNDLMYIRSSTFAVNAAVIGAVTAFERHYPSTAEDMFMLIHQNSLVAVSATYASLFAHDSLDKLVYLPPFLKDIVAHLDTPQIKSNLRREGLRPRRSGIIYTSDFIELRYNVPLNNHSMAFQIIYNYNTQECILSIQFLGQARTRWAQIALLAGISPFLSGLELQEAIVLDEKAGITTWQWIIKDKASVATMFQYLVTMASISNGSDLRSSSFSSLYNNTEPLQVIMPKALSYYKKHYAANAVVDQWLRHFTQ